MNLSPEWVKIFKTSGWEASHWSEVGNPRAKDIEIMQWAKKHQFVVFTHDLDFGMLLALTQAEGPSVIQVRTQDVTPGAMGVFFVQVLRKFEKILDEGALVVVDEASARARILPFSSS